MHMVGQLTGCLKRTSSGASKACTAAGGSNNLKQLGWLTCHENRLPSFCAGYSIKVICKGLLQTTHMGSDAHADSKHHDDLTLHLLNKQAYE